MEVEGASHTVQLLGKNFLDNTMVMVLRLWLWLPEPPIRTYYTIHFTGRFNLLDNLLFFGDRQHEAFWPLNLDSKCAESAQICWTLDVYIETLYISAHPACRVRACEITCVSVYNQHSVNSWKVLRGRFRR